MKKLLSTVAVVAAVFAGASGCAPITPPPVAPRPVVTGHPNGSVRMLTYNVAGLPESLSGSTPSVNTQLISPKLNAYEIVNVQESWKEPVPNPYDNLHVYHDVLEAQATHAYKTVSMPVPLGNDPRRPSALLSDGLNQFSRFPMSAVTRVMWDNCYGGPNVGAADCLAEKGFSVVTITLAPGVLVDVFNLHAEAGSEGYDQLYQSKDYDQLAAYIKANSVGRAIIVGGDTNLHTEVQEDSDIWNKFLRAASLNDVCQVVTCGSDRNIIDKFAFRSAGTVGVWPTSYHFERNVFVDGIGQPLSDHDALRVDFQWVDGR